MIGSIVHSVLAVIAGLVAAMFFVVATEVVWGVVYPPAPGVDLHHMEACKAHIAKLPADAFVVASVGWGLAVLAGSWVATRLGPGRHRTHGLVVGSILLTAAVANMLMLPYPVLFWVLNLVTFTAGESLGTKWGQARTSDGNTTATERGASSE
ncbi:MAG: hypothetical protein AABP62_16155 [Planctomycetota bacterium]